MDSFHYLSMRAPGVMTAAQINEMSKVKRDKIARNHTYMHQGGKQIINLYFLSLRETL
jgi:hypothetical protein